MRNQRGHNAQRNLCKTAVEFFYLLARLQACLQAGLCVRHWLRLRSRRLLPVENLASVKAGQFFLVENISSPILSCPLLPDPTHSSRNAKPPAPAGSDPAGTPSGRIQQEHRPAGLHPAGLPSDPARAHRIAQDRAKSCKAQNPTLPARSLSNAVSSGFWANPSPNPLQIHPFRARIRPFLWEEHRPLSWTWEVFRRHRFLGFRTVPRTTLSEAAVPTRLPRNGKPPSPQAYFPWYKEHLRIPKTTNLGIPLLVTVPGRQKVYLSKEISVGPWEGIPRDRFYP